MINFCDNDFDLNSEKKIKNIYKKCRNDQDLMEKQNIFDIWIYPSCYKITRKVDDW